MQRLILFSLLLGACHVGPQKEAAKTTTHSPSLPTKNQSSSKNNFEITTFQSANGWSYQIRQNGKLIIDQPTIPSRSWILGFNSQADAQKVAELVRSKLQAKVFPPSVSEADLQNLNIH